MEKLIFFAKKSSTMKLNHKKKEIKERIIDKMEWGGDGEKNSDFKEKKEFV